MNLSFLTPPCPVCGGQPATDRRIIIILVIALIIITGLYISDYRIKPWNITCSSPDITIDTGVMVHNNIQAAHTYPLENIGTKNDTVILKEVNDVGLLWGSSMQPTFFEGNTVLVKDYNNGTLHTGDLIRYFRYTDTYPNCTTIHSAIANNSLGGSYINNDMAVIHRINSIYDDTIVTQGDNLNEIESIDRCQVTDTVVGILFT